MKTCPTCQGAGQVNRVMNTIFGAMQQAVTCETCGGKGKVPEKVCTVCHGKGIGLREGKNYHLSGAQTAYGSIVAVELLAQLKTGNVPEMHNLRGLSGYTLNNDIFELLYVRKTAQTIDRELKGLTGRYRRPSSSPPA